MDFIGMIIKFTIGLTLIILFLKDAVKSSQNNNTFEENTPEQSSSQCKLEELLKHVKRHPHSRETAALARECLNAENPELRYHAALYLKEYQPLRDLLFSAPEDMIHLILSAMWKTDHFELTYDMAFFLKTVAATGFRCSLIRWMGNHPDPRLIPALVSCLKDPLIRIVQATADALGRFQSPEIIPHLKRAAKKYADNPELKTIITNSLEKLNHLENKKKAGMLSIEQDSRKKGRLGKSEFSEGGLSQNKAGSGEK